MIRMAVSATASLHGASQEKSHREDGKKADHVLYPGCLDCRGLVQFDQARR